jgi:rSAM/selenodomain-associated transferase 1
MTAPRRTVIVFLKAPRLGRVKSRLAGDIGRVAAWRFYAAQSRAVIRRLAADRRWRLLLAVTPDEWREPAPDLRRLPHIGQGRGDLGRRMRRALRAAGPGPAVLVGGDIPGIAPSHLWSAFRALGRAPLVFGPAEDGGYWLVGCAHASAMPDIFRGVRWSTAHALADTLANLPAGRRYALVDRLWDVDTGADYARLFARPIRRR